MPSPLSPDEAFDAALAALDHAAICALIEQGYDMNAVHRGDSLFERLLSRHIPGDPGTQPMSLVLAMMRQLTVWGADPLVLGHDGSSALVDALFANDAALAATLLVVGVDPNRGGGEFPGQTLLDLAIYDYEFDVSETGGFALPPQAADDATVDTWLAYLMRASKAEGRKGPEVAWTMRHRGAKTGAEIVAELGGTAQDRAVWTDQGWHLDTHI